MHHIVDHTNETSHYFGAEHLAQGRFANLRSCINLTEVVETLLLLLSSSSSLPPQKPSQTCFQSDSMCLQFLQEGLIKMCRVISELKLL